MLLYNARAKDDRAHAPFVRKSYISGLCPVVLCPHLCTSDRQERRMLAVWRATWTPRPHETATRF